MQLLFSSWLARNGRPNPLPWQRPRATSAGRLRRGASAALGAATLSGLLLLAGCSTSAQRVVVYDFGPGPTQAAVANPMAPLPPVLLAEVEAPSALDGTALWYRLLYADAQQLRPYAQARWSTPPAQLLRLRLRELLGQRRTLLSPTDALPPATLVLRLELEEFSQLFSTAQASTGLVRLRATLGRSGSPARVLAQTSLVLQQPSATADAAGGVRALTLATEALAQQLEAWLLQASAAEVTP
jgi:cholesterol transport system auxiliary component